MYKINTESIGDVKKFVWHYRKGIKEYGPFTYEDIVEKVKLGEIGPEDYVLKFGNKKFVKASEVQGLHAVITQPAALFEEKAEIIDDQVDKEEKSVIQGTLEENKVSTGSLPNSMRGSQKQTVSGRKITLIIAGAAGLCLAAWVLIRLL